MLDKSINPASIASNSARKNLFIYVLIVFNLLFLSYVLTIGYFNRLVLDDYAFQGTMREYGFFSPFKYWYFEYQGRFGPQFLINIVLAIYDVIQNLFFYTAFISSLFVYAIYKILRFYFPLSKFYLINYSTFFFSALVLTTFELSTFYWLNVSAMYFGGVLFVLIGTGLILNPRHALFHYLIIALCFLFAGSSSEHAGIIGCFILGLLLLVSFHNSRYSLKSFFALTINRKQLTAFFFCSVAFIIMVLAPGNKVRMSAFQQITDPMKVLEISLNSSVYILQHLFYKLPYFIPLIGPFVFFGASLKTKIKLKRINLVGLTLFCILSLCLLIYMSNIPAGYAMGAAGPLRSYVFVNLSLVATLFIVCFYIGYQHLSDSKILQTLASLSASVLFIFVFHSFRKELPLVKKYYQTDKERVDLLRFYKHEQRKETAILQPLYKSKYVTLSDRFRMLTHTAHLPSEVTDLPLAVGDIRPVADWRNSQVKYGLGLEFEILLSPNEEVTKAEMDSIKMFAQKSYDTSKFKFFILDNFIYYQIHVPSYDKVPAYIYCRPHPVNPAVLKTKEDQKFYEDFSIADAQMKFKGDVSGYENFIFVKKEITKFPIKKIETGFYDVVNGALEFSNGMEIQFTQNTNPDINR